MVNDCTTQRKEGKKDEQNVHRRRTSNRLKETSESEEELRLFKDWKEANVPV